MYHISISPYVTGRLCRLKVSRLAGLGCDDLWAEIEAVDRAREELVALEAAVSEDLLRLVNQQPDARAMLVALRRDVHNGRAARVTTALAGASLPSSARSVVRPWLQLHESVQQMESALPDVLQRWEDRWRLSAADIFADDAVAPGVQLSGQDLYMSISDYISADCGASYKRSKRRSVEASMCNFLYRAALKPTPFGRFVAVTAFPFDAAYGLAAGRGEVSVVRANRVLVNWLFGVSPLADVRSDLAVLSLSSTLEDLGDGTLRFVANSAEMGAHGYCGYATVRVRADEVLADLVALLGAGPALATSCLALVADRLGGEEKAAAYLDALVRVGLLFCRLPVPEQDAGYLEAMGLRLAESDTPRASWARKGIETLMRVEKELPSAGLKDRGELLGRTREVVSDISDRFGVRGPSEESLKAPVYEDVVSGVVPQSWNPGLVQKELPALEALWRLSAVLDYGQLKRVGMYAFTRSLGADSETMSLADLFERFVVLPTAQQDDILAGRSCPEGRAFVRARETFKADVFDAVGIADDGSWRLAASDIMTAADRVTTAAWPESVTFRLQFGLKATSSGRLVVNGVNTGFGAFFSRFCGTLDPSEDGWLLDDAIRDHLRRTFPNQVDINAVFGLNFNIHPLLAPRVLDYPGGTLDQQACRVLLSEVMVRLDHDAQQVRLVSRGSGEPVDLLPMNFLIPLWSPPLYKMIEGLSPTLLYPWRPATDLVGGAPGSVPSSTQRLVVDDVVADRRAWVVPADACPHLGGLARGDLDAIISMDAWRREQGWPERAFVLCQTVDEYDLLGGRNPLLARSLDRVTHMRRAAVHKPMYVDLRNPMLLRSLARNATSRRGVIMFVRECLPDFEDYAGGLAPSAEEFFVELNRRG